MVNKKDLHNIILIITVFFNLVSFASKFLLIDRNVFETFYKKLFKFVIGKFLGKTSKIIIIVYF